MPKYTVHILAKMNDLDVDIEVEAATAKEAAQQAIDEFYENVENYAEEEGCEWYVNEEWDVNVDEIEEGCTEDQGAEDSGEQPEKESKDA